MFSEKLSSNSLESLNVLGLTEFKPLLEAFPVVREKTGYSGKLYMSGGKVRDALIGRTDGLSDFDFWGDFDLEYILQSSGLEVVSYWSDIGVLKVKIDDKLYEFIQAKDIVSVLAENDINSSNILLSEDGNLIDHFGGLESLRRHEVKVNEPLKKFQKDPSQILRVFKFAEVFGFEIEQETMEAINTGKGLIPSATEENLAYEVESILGLPERQKFKIINHLQRAGIYLDSFDQYKRDCDSCINIEQRLALELVINDVKNLFPDNELRLVGGAVREYIWDGRANDYDFIVDLDMEEAIRDLKQLGYVESTNITLHPKEYFVNLERNVLSIFTSDVDVDFACRPGYEIDREISLGDINFSCGVYDVHRREFENPEMIPVIDRRELSFCDPTRIKEDPILVLSALKQLSRVSGVTISFR